jgi:adenylate cyclase
MVKDGDIFRDGVNVAARLQNLADGGGICVSRRVRDHLRNRVNFLFEDLGEQLALIPIRAYRLRMGEAQRESDGSGEPSEIALSDETGPSADNEMTLELTLWNSVKDGGRDELASYLEHYPEGALSSLARTRQAAPIDEAVEADIPRYIAGDAMPETLDAAFWDAIKGSQTPEELTPIWNNIRTGILRGWLGHGCNDRPMRGCAPRCGFDRRCD